MYNPNGHIINKNSDARTALKVLDELGGSFSRTLFVIDDDEKMVGSITDGDIRRGLLNGNEISGAVETFMHKEFKFLYESENNTNLIKDYRKKNIELIPLLDKGHKILQILDLTSIKTLLPASALILAGGRGERLKPFTDLVPKPMLNIGNKPLLEYNIERLALFGISDIFISVKYLKNQIMDHFGDGSSKGVRITYLEEDESLGTIGSLSLIDKIEHDDLFVMNADLLTNINFEDFFDFYKQKKATMAVASIPYLVNVPYAVLETNNYEIAAFTEKPTFTYYSNGGIYLMNFKVKNFIPHNSFYNITDLMSKIILDKDHSLIHYPLLDYWLDIGRPQDYYKAQEDIKHIKI